MMGRLVGALGLERQTANAIVAVIMSGGVYTAAAIWPVIAPFLATIQGITAVVGFAGVAGF